MAASDATSTPFSSSKSLRGLNKPKCIKCGNVARSRCPFQSCKNCCAKAQNPCHIHVLKGSSSLPEKPPSSSSPQVDQQPAEASYSVNINRLRQLSNNFAQFSNLQAPLRARKPLTKKDAQVINEWRFMKLKEFRDGNIQAETEAFDRYMQNVGLLEEVFSVDSSPIDKLIQEEEQSSPIKSQSDGENTETMIQQLKSKLGSNPSRKENFRKRIRYIVDQGLKKLGKLEPTDVTGEVSDAEATVASAKKMKFPQGERSIAALDDLHDKLNKARNEEDLKPCHEMASHIFGWNEKPNLIESAESSAKRQVLAPKWIRSATVEQGTLSKIDAHFSSLKDIEEL